MTYYHVTNISVNSEELDGYTVFNYPISLANGWNYVKQQLNDNRDYIYDMDLQSAEAYVNSDYDLTQHQKFSGVSMGYLDPETNERYIPYVIEPSLGVERLVLTVLCNAYEEETLEDGSTREVLHLHPYLAPYKLVVLPLVKKHHQEKAMEIYKTLQKSFISSMFITSCFIVSRSLIVTVPFSIVSSSIVMANGVPTTSALLYLFQIFQKILMHFSIS